MGGGGLNKGFVCLTAWRGEGSEGSTVSKGECNATVGGKLGFCRRSCGFYSVCVQGHQEWSILYAC